MKKFFKSRFNERRWCKNFARPLAVGSLGRSMIEMLGVLAIIGVLSIGGLYAYRQAMLRYKAGRIVDFINRLQLTSLDAGFSKVKMNSQKQFIKFACSAGFLKVEECKLIVGSDRGGSDLLGYEWRAYMQEAFVFSLFNVPTDMCLYLVNQHYDNIDSIYARWGKAHGFPTPNGIISDITRKQLENDCRAYETGNFVLQWFLD